MIPTLANRCEACGHSFIGEDSEHTGNLTHWFGGDGSIWCTFCKEDGSSSACSILVAKLPYARGALTEKDALLKAEKANSKNAWDGQNDLRRRLEFETAKHSEDHQRAEAAEAKLGHALFALHLIENDPCRTGCAMLAMTGRIRGFKKTPEFEAFLDSLPKEPKA